MNRERAKELLPIIQAFAEGKEIQYISTLPNDHHVWLFTSSPQWADEHDYRIKPEPRELWLVSYNEVSCSLYPTKEEAEKDFSCGKPQEIIHLREVIE